MKFFGHDMYKDAEGKWWIKVDKKSGTYQDFKSWTETSPEITVLILVPTLLLLTILTFFVNR